MQLFSDSFRDLLWAKLSEHGASGEGIPNKRLTELCGFSDSEEPVVRAAVKSLFIDQGMVEVEKGKNGGYFLTGVERVKSHAAKFDISAEYLAKVRETTLRLLNQKSSGVPVGIIAGQLGELSDAKVRAAYVHLSDEFEIVRSGGVRKRKDKNPALIPADAKTSAESAQPEPAAAE